MVSVPGIPPDFARRGAHFGAVCALLANRHIEGSRKNDTGTNGLMKTIPGRMTAQWRQWQSQFANVVMLRQS